LFISNVVACFLIGSVFAAAQSQPDERQIKAAFIFHFAQMVEWPRPALLADNRPLIFCFVGENSYVGDLESIVQGKQIGLHPIRIQRMKDKDDLRACHVLVLDGTDAGRAGAIVAGLKNAPVLTVADCENFVQYGGMIGLCLDENKIRFEINLKAAQLANIKISSRLLLLAKTVIVESKAG
jgi:hypothetical protein